MSYWRVASRSSFPLAAAYCSQQLTATTSSWPPSSTKSSSSSGWVALQTAQCDEGPPQASDLLKRPQRHSSSARPHQGMNSEEQGDYHGLFPKRQLWQPKVEYPLWDKNWDGHEPPGTGDKEKDREQMRHIRKAGVTRHIILIRHGQYDEDQKEDEKRKLTELGKLQAELTGKRLREMITAEDGKGISCRVRYFRVSNMARAKETAEIIANHLPGVELLAPDPALNEGRPCHHIPGVKATPKIIDVTDDNHRRIENAYQTLFYRASLPEQLPPAQEGNSTPTDAPEDHHEFEIIVCHANVIRYFVCRALQLPPEAWLRFCPFNCSLTYLTIRPTGSVGCRLLGDIGHLPYNTVTFSKHHGYNW